MTSIHYSSEGKYFRKPLSDGLQGMLSKSAKEVGDSIKDAEKLAKLNTS